MEISRMSLCIFVFVFLNAVYVSSTEEVKTVAAVHSVQPTLSKETKGTAGNKNASDTLATSQSSKNETAKDCKNGTDCSKEGGLLDGLYDKITRNQGMLLRTLYVLIGVTAIVVVYFVVRAWRLRRRRRKARKYGIITTPASDLEMAPLGQGDDDDDEDMTVFEMNGRTMK